MQMTIAPWWNFKVPNSSVSPHILPKNRTIRLVEGQSDLRWVLKHKLEMNRYTYLKAANGREALSLIQPHPSIRLILSDYLMPERNGVQRLYVLPYTVGSQMHHNSSPSCGFPLQEPGMKQSV